MTYLSHASCHLTSNSACRFIHSSSTSVKYLEKTKDKANRTTFPRQSYHRANPSYNTTPSEMIAPLFLMVKFGVGRSLTITFFLVIHRSEKDFVRKALTISASIVTGFVTLAELKPLYKISMTISVMIITYRHSCAGLLCLLTRKLRKKRLSINKLRSLLRLLVGRGRVINSPRSIFLFLSVSKVELPQMGDTAGTKLREPI